MDSDDFFSGVMRRCVNPNFVLTDDESAAAFRRLLADSGSREEFRRRFAEVMNDKSMTWADKVSLYIGESYSPEMEAEAKDWLEDAWFLAFDERWHP